MCQNTQLSAEELAKRIGIFGMSIRPTRGMLLVHGLAPLGVRIRTSPVEHLGGYTTCYLPKEKDKGKMIKDCPVIRRGKVEVTSFTERHYRGWPVKVQKKGYLQVVEVIGHNGKRGSVILTEEAPKRAPFPRQPALVGASSRS